VLPDIIARELDALFGKRYGPVDDGQAMGAGAGQEQKRQRS
jgi:hypothetical protein